MSNVSCHIVMLLASWHVDLFSLRITRWLGASPVDPTLDTHTRKASDRSNKTSNVVAILLSSDTCTRITSIITSISK